jgi:hypothetical protein
MELIQEFATTDWRAFASLGGAALLCALVVTGAAFNKPRRWPYFLFGLLFLAMGGGLGFLAQQAHAATTPQGLAWLLTRMIQNNQVLEAVKLAEKKAENMDFQEVGVHVANSPVKDFRMLIAASKRPEVRNAFLNAQIKNDPRTALEFASSKDTDSAQRRATILNLSLAAERGEIPFVSDEDFYTKLDKEFQSLNIPRTLSYERIISAYIKHPQGMELAEKLLKHIKEGPWRCEAMMTIADSKINQGTKDDAHKLLIEAIENAKKAPDGFRRIHLLGLVAERLKKNGFSQDVTKTDQGVKEETCLTRGPVSDTSWLERLAAEVAYWRKMGNIKQADELINEAWKKLNAEPPSERRGIVFRNWMSLTEPSEGLGRLVLDGASGPPGKIPDNDPPPPQVRGQTSGS